MDEKNTDSIFGLSQVLVKNAQDLRAEICKVFAKDRISGAPKKDEKAHEQPNVLTEIVHHLKIANETIEEAGKIFKAGIEKLT